MNQTPTANPIIFFTLSSSFWYNYPVNNEIIKNGDCFHFLTKRGQKRTVPIFREAKMKKDIHPEFVECTITCACGNTFMTRSAKKEIRVEICSQCHPFFTGKQKFIDSAGRVEKFKKKYGDIKLDKK